LTRELRQILRTRPRAVAIVLAALALALVLATWAWKAWQPAGVGALAASFGDCRDRADLPDGRIVCARPVPGQASDDSLALYTAGADGEPPHRITFGETQDRAPALLPDGRIVFRRQQGQAPGRLFAMNTDGTGLQLFCDPDDGASIQGGPWVMADRVVFSERMFNGAGEHRISVSVQQPFGSREQLSDSAPPTNGVVARTKPLSLTSVVDERKSTGTLLCLDVRTSRLPAVAGMQPKTLRVLTSDGHVLGEAPVEADGSFFVEIPADQPLQLALEGPNGIVAADHSGFWVRPNENRGCIGCHEDPELAPENRVVAALAHGPLPIKANVSVTPPEARPQ
jgi:hypothetical protein